MNRSARLTDIAAVPEYRAVLGAAALSSAGDMLAKAALTYLVFVRTGSVAWSAATFAIGYFPWVVGGPLLSAYAERHPFRRTMIGCDLVRVVSIGLVALPGLPLAGILALLFVTSLFTPPFESARSALVAQLLSGELYVSALAVQGVVNQVTQLGGYVIGGVVAAFSPRLAIGIDAATFAVSAMLITRVTARPTPMTEQHRSNLLREAAEGFAVVFGRPALRAIALVVFTVVTFVILPEGLAAAWTAELGGGPVAQSLLMAAPPLGGAAGGLVIARLVPLPARLKLIRPLAVAAPAVLAIALVRPPYPVVLVLAVVSSFAATGAVIACNGLFVRVLPDAYRARAFGIMAGGLYIVQGGAVAVAGLAGQGVPVPAVVGGWGLAGILIMAAIGLTWPAPDAFRAEPAAAPAATGAADQDPAT
jgi:hypothetical protein